MSKFKDKGSGGTPAISTASLPDIIFMLLFFFMVTTVMREVDPLVKVTLPEATEVTKLEDKALVDYIYIGPPTNPELGTSGFPPPAVLPGSAELVSLECEYV